MCFKAIAAVAAIAAVLTTSASAAGTTPSGGVIGIYATPGMSGAVARIVITGAIGDYGTATTIDKDGKVDQNGGYVRIVLKHGGFEVNSIALNKKADDARPTTNSGVDLFVLGLSPPGPSRSSTARACTRGSSAVPTSPRRSPASGPATRAARRRGNAT